MLNLLNRIIASHFILFSADADVRLARRIRRDTVEKARDIAAVLDQVICSYHLYSLKFSTDTVVFLFIARLLLSGIVVLLMFNP